MEDLHAVIARFLRSQRPAAATAAPELPAPSVPRQRVFSCRFCGARIWQGAHGSSFHFDELWEATSCEACHRERLRLEAKAGSTGSLLWQAWHRAAVIKPRCKRCGEVIDAGTKQHTIAELRAVRECADCHASS